MKNLNNNKILALVFAISLPFIILELVFDIPDFFGIWIPVVLWGSYILFVITMLIKKNIEK